MAGSSPTAGRRYAKHDRSRKAALTVTVGAPILAPMEDLVSGDLRVALATPEPGRLVATWTGKSNERAPGKALDPFLAALVRDAAARGLALEMRFETLEHFNSATVTCLIGLVQQARGAGVRLELVYDRALKWQRLSFEALRALAKGDGLLVIRTA